MEAHFTTFHAGSSLVIPVLLTDPCRAHDIVSATHDTQHPSILLVTACYFLATVLHFVALRIKHVAASHLDAIRSPFCVQSAWCYAECLRLSHYGIVNTMLIDNPYVPRAEKNEACHF